jgi:hypothetical protein
LLVHDLGLSGSVGPLNLIYQGILATVSKVRGGNGTYNIGIRVVLLPQWSG